MVDYFVNGPTGSVASLLGDLPITLTRYTITGEARGRAELLPVDLFTNSFSIASAAGPLVALAVIEPTNFPFERAAGGTASTSTPTVVQSTTLLALQEIHADVKVSAADGTAITVGVMQGDNPGGYLVFGLGGGAIAAAVTSNVVTGGAAVLEGNLPIDFKIQGEVTPPAALGYAYHLLDGEEGNSTEVIGTAELDGDLIAIGTRRSPPMVFMNGTNYLERTVDDAVLDGSATFTISITVNPELILPGQDCTIASKNQDVAGGYGWRIFYTQSTGVVTIKVWESNDGTDFVQRGTSSAIRSRSRVTFVYDAGALSVFVNGVSDEGGETKSGTATAPNTSDEPFALGCDAPSTNPTSGLFIGAIYDFAFWSTNLSSGEAAKLRPNGGMISAQIANLEVWWSSARIRANGVNASFRTWVDEEASLTLTNGNPAGAAPIYALEDQAGLPGAAPLPMVYDWGISLQDALTLIPPNQGFASLYQLSSNGRWRLWSAGALSPIIIGFKPYLGDFTCVVTVARPEGTNTATILRLYGIRVECQVSAGVSTITIIKGIDTVSSTNRQITYPIGLPDGRDLLGGSPLVQVDQAVKILVIRYNSYDNEVDLIDAGFGRVTPTDDSSTASSETRTDLEIAGLIDFQRALFIPACLNDLQIEQLLLGFQPEVWSTGSLGASASRPHLAYPLPVHDLHNPPFEDRVEDEHIRAATSSTTAAGKLIYAGPPGGIELSSVTLRIPSDAGSTQFLTYVDNGFGGWASSGGSPAPTAGHIYYQGQKATGSVTIAVGNVSPGDTVTLVDAYGNALTFVFVSGTPSGPSLVGKQVEIGAANTDTAANLVQAVTDAAIILKITAVQAGNVVNLTQVGPFATGNTTITVSGANLSKSDFANGQTAGDWSLTITGGGDEFDTARYDGTVDYTWNSRGTARSAAAIDFDFIEIIVTNIYNVPAGPDTRFAPYSDAPFIIKDGGEDLTATGGAGVFLDPQPVIVTVTADVTNQVLAIANAGPTDAGDLITYWEVELVSGNTETYIHIDRTIPNSFAVNRNHTDTFQIPAGQNYNNKRIRFVIIAVDDANQSWQSLYFRMEGDNFDNDPPTIITQVIVQGGSSVSAEDLLSIQEQEALVLSRASTFRPRLQQVPGNSRYKLTPLFDGDRGLEYGLMAVLEDFASSGRDFRVYRVKAAEVGFLDRIAVTFYGDGFEWAWWVLAYANNIVDPDFDMFEDQELIIPARSAIQRFQARRLQTYVNPVGL